MKLNPEELEVMSFDTGADAAQASLDQAAAIGPLDPTPNSRCFVCEYT
ncbi:MAG TPA: hypothetical protein VLK84_15250 [Longimicrobium sp.]|nr:hypothetical protein [Longimicrobium sp.]